MSVLVMSDPPGATDATRDKSADKPNTVARPRRERVSITLPPELVAWLDRHVAEHTYSSRADAVEQMTIRAMQWERMGLPVRLPLSTPIINEKTRDVLLHYFASMHED